MIGIYKIISPSGKVYIGQSTNIEKRFSNYKRYNCKYQIKIYNSLQKHGVENHNFEIIEECVIDILNERERYWQDFYKSINNGLNCRATLTNDKTGYFSEETKKRMSISAKKKFFTEDHLRKITQELIKTNKKRAGIPKSKEQRDKISKTLTGRTNDFMRGFNHHYGVIVLDTSNGIYYGSIAECARLNDLNRFELQRLLRGINNKINNTKFLIV